MSERWEFFGEGGERALGDGCCRSRMGYWRVDDRASVVKKHMRHELTESFRAEVSSEIK